MNDRLDIGDLVEGYQIGRTQRIADWQFRKEKRDFAKLCRSLKHRRWRKAIHAEGGERQAKRNAANRRQKEKERARAHEAHRAAGAVTTCPSCGAAWCLLPGMHGRHLVWCSEECKRAGKRTALNARYRKHAKGRDTKCGLCRERGHNRRSCPLRGDA